VEYSAQVSKPIKAQKPSMTAIVVATDRNAGIRMQPLPHINRFIITAISYGRLKELP
jgi:hypothetical protein